MTRIKKKAVEMIQRMPDEKMVYVIDILQNIEALSGDGEKADRNIQKSRDAFLKLKQFRKTLPADFDYKSELARARDEKYESAN